MNGESAVFFLFYFSRFIFESFSFYFILFLTVTNLLMFVLVRKRLLFVFDRCSDVQVWGMP